MCFGCTLGRLSFFLEITVVDLNSGRDSRKTSARARRREILNKRFPERFPSALPDKSDKLRLVFRRGTLRCRSLLKLNCIINASRTISDGLYGNLRARASVEIRKGITRSLPRQLEPPYHHHRRQPRRPCSSSRATSRAKGFIQLIL